MMRRMSSAAGTAVLAFLLSALAALAHAQGTTRACVITSTLRAMGTPTVVTDCLQGAKGVSRPAIKERCEGVAWHAAAGLGKRDLSLLRWVDQCPKRADAVCNGAFEGDFNVYYYNRTPGQLAAMAEQCATEQGRWRQFD